MLFVVDARNVVPRLRIDLDLVARVDEKWHTALVPGLQGRRLLHVAALGVPFNTRLTVRNDEIHRGRQLHGDTLPIVHDHVHVGSLLEILRPVVVLLDPHLLVRLRVHENVVVVLGVRESHLLLVHGGQLQGLAGAEGLVIHIAGDVVLVVEEEEEEQGVGVGGAGEARRRRGGG